MANNDGSNRNNAKIWCIKIIKFVPILFIMAITAWSYYAYVIEFCYITLNISDPSTIVFLVFFHVAFVMYSWTYMMTVCTPNASVPETFNLPDSEYEILLHAESEEMQNQILENFAKDLPLNNRTINGTIRYCEKCRLLKPDRAHHCSVCGECVLKMDHHCPWVNNCISFSNYKYFILFLFYSLIYSLYVFLTTTPYVIAYWQDSIQSVSNVHVLFLFFVGVMCAISLVSLFSYHCYLVMFNRTTLEAFRAPIFKDGTDKYGYNLGHCKNFKEVFGDNFLLWPFPVGKSKGNGYTFPRRHVPEEQHLLAVSPHSTDYESESWTTN